MTMHEDSGTVTGNGQLSFSSAPNSPLSLSAYGTHDHPDVVLTLSASGYASATFTAKFVSPTIVRGTLSNSGFGGDVLVLQKN